MYKKNVGFLVYKDTVNNYGDSEVVITKKRILFRENNVGKKRYYQAVTNGLEITKNILLRLPPDQKIGNVYYLEINGEDNKYKIENISNYSKNTYSLDLSIRSDN